MKKIVNFIYSAYLVCIYKVFHIHNEKYNGWFVKKKPIVMILISPILLPFFMLYGIILYWDWSTNYYYHWIEAEKRKLTFKEKLYIKRRLVK